MSDEMRAIASGADDLMHAAQYLAGVSKNNYSDPAVWDSTDAAIVMLRERYAELSNIIDYIWILIDIEREQR